MPSRSSITEGSIVAGTSRPRAVRCASQPAVGEILRLVEPRHVGKRQLARPVGPASLRARCRPASPAQIAARSPAARLAASSHASQIAGRLGSPSPVTNRSMNGASGSGFWRTGRRRSPADRPASARSAWSGMRPRSSIVSRLLVQISYCSVKPNTSNSRQRREGFQAVERQLGRAQLLLPCRARA